MRSSLSGMRAEGAGVAINQPHQRIAPLMFLCFAALCMLSARMFSGKICGLNR